MSPLVVLMGVAGAGKTEVGRALAARLGVPFVDADDYHSAASVARMRAGIPLTEAERRPWLRRLASLIERAWLEGEGLVLACSALRREHRRLLRGRTGDELRFVHLAASEALLRRRLLERRGHFLPATLLDSQLVALEPPGPDERITELDAAQPVATLVDAIVEVLRRLDR